MADITLINLNMLYIRYGEQTERELHVPLGPLYLTRALEDAGFKVDFRDYQLCDADDPFEMSTCLLYTSDAADDLPCVDLGGRRIIQKHTTTIT